MRHKIPHVQHACAFQGTYRRSCMRVLRLRHKGQKLQAYNSRSLALPPFVDACAPALLRSLVPTGVRRGLATGASLRRSCRGHQPTVSPTGPWSAALPTSAKPFADRLRSLGSGWVSCHFARRSRRSFARSRAPTWLPACGGGEHGGDSVQSYWKC